MKKLHSCISMFIALILILSLCAPGTALAAPAWPDQVNIQAEGGILIDADSGAVLYGKNIHVSYYPASITKILTALIVIEKCNLDDTITFSHDAIYNVEKGSTSAGYDVGDQITVRQALYCMLLKSANEVANALAEHCAGSIDAFADMMNAKAKALGCTDSHFVNPSGLNNENHYTTPYDYALIAKAAYANPTFVEFDSTTYYELPANSKNKSSFTVYCGHKMLKKDSKTYYYPGIIGGKTGYTTLAGNTLVTCAERDGMKLICVILNGHQTHYTDTKALLDFGFANFKNLKISDYDTTYTSLQEDLNLTGNSATVFKIDDTRSVTLPKDANLSDAKTKISYDLTDQDPKGAIARIDYSYEDRAVGSTWLLADNSTVQEKKGGASMGKTAPAATPADNRPAASLPAKASKIPLPFRILIGVLIGAALLFGIYRLLKLLVARQEAKETSLSREKRRQRFAESGFNDGLIKDTSASTGSFMKDTRSRKKKKSGGLFRHHNRT